MPNNKIPQFTGEELESAADEVGAELEAAALETTQFLERVRSMKQFQDFGFRQHQGIIQTNPIGVTTLWCG